jgi:hypothetical protein
MENKRLLQVKTQIDQERHNYGETFNVLSFYSL